MNDDPAQTAEIAALMHDHGERWQIEHDPGMDVWSAVRRSPDGRHIRVLVGRDIGALRGKLETVEEDEPGPDYGPGVAMPGGGWISGPSLPPT